MAPVPLTQLCWAMPQVEPLGGFVLSGGDLCLGLEETIQSSNNVLLGRSPRQSTCWFGGSWKGRTPLLFRSMFPGSLTIFGKG